MPASARQKSALFARLRPPVGDGPIGDGPIESAADLIVVRMEGQGLLKFLDGLVEPALLLEELAEMDVSVEISWIGADGQAILVDGLVDLASAMEKRGQVVVGLGVFGVAIDGQLIVRHRRIKIAPTLEGQSQVVVPLEFLGLHSRTFWQASIDASISPCWKSVNARLLRARM